MQNNGSAFKESDIALFEAFAIFCGIGIHNTKMYEGAIKLMAKQKVALDCLSYHASASQADTDALAKADIPSAAKYSLHRYVILVYDSLAGYNISSIFLLVVRVEIDSITAKPYIPQKS